MLVVDAKGFVEAGPWGDVLTAMAQKVGIAGLVIHGAVRDAHAIVDAGFPVWCRGLSIKGTAKCQPGRINVPVTIGDVVIHPGDIVVADRDGIAVVPADRIDAGARRCARAGTEGIPHARGDRPRRDDGRPAEPDADAAPPRPRVTFLPTNIQTETLPCPT